ncbi:hypothetical protein [Caldisalinibacter kiritimatiensis]|uniref:Uncharacterized protein n=1 Tax=Caldisalinibacter kiritimatiensis TaxID=1304284 RepID=R1CGM4_9FIRM|nr:hypothetical protein [Caldisalinibacter kiritimatiensis]EOD01445.1 hypothetical protein L21TH_0492 [Caldisalinibacter kiritimatiensis]
MNGRNIKLEIEALNYIVRILQEEKASSIQEILEEIDENSNFPLFSCSGKEMLSILKNIYPLKEEKKYIVYGDYIK